MLINFNLARVISKITASGFPCMYTIVSIPYHLRIKSSTNDLILPTKSFRSRHLPFWNRMHYHTITLSYEHRAYNAHTNPNANNAHSEYLIINCNNPKNKLSLPVLISKVGSQIPDFKFWSLYPWYMVQLNSTDGVHKMITRWRPNAFLKPQL